MYKAILPFLLPVLTVSALAEKPIASSPNKQLWKQWYIYSINNKAAGYYSEELELYTKEKELHLSQHWWEKDSASKTPKETYLGIVAKNDNRITPIAFYVEKKSSQEIINVEGRIVKNILKLQFKHPGSKADNIEKLDIAITKNTIFSALFSKLISLKGLQGHKKPFDFDAILEDNTDGKYMPRAGKAQILNEKIKLNGDECYKVQLIYSEIPSMWWITKNGKLCKAVTPANATEIKQASEAEAKASLQ